jgi:multiple antibiotic resistance protein
VTICSAAILLFFVLDPIGNVALFVPALARVEPRRRIRVLVRELLIALGALLLFLGLGGVTLRALAISPPALSISGGVVLFLIAVNMIFHAGGAWLTGEEGEGEPFIVPLAIPLVAGPSALATLLLLVAREPGSTVRWLLALLLAWAASSCILLLSSPISRALGARGLAALERLMGMLLTTVAVQMLLEGVSSFLKGRG